MCGHLLHPILNQGNTRSLASRAESSPCRIWVHFFWDSGTERTQKLMQSCRYMRPAVHVRRAHNDGRGTRDSLVDELPTKCRYGASANVRLPSTLVLEITPLCSAAWQAIDSKSK